MIKVCSLDFLNKENFDVDVMTSEGRVLCSCGDKITPDLLLSLYYKEIYIEYWPAKEVTYEAIEESKEEEEEDSPEDIAKAESTVAELFMPLDKVEESKESEEIEQFDPNEQLDFDEEQATRVRDYSLNLGKLLNFSQDELRELEQAAYYHNVGRARLTRGDLAQKGFRKKQADASYEILLNEKVMPERVAETAKLYLDNYNPITFKLDGEIPYKHIVAITNYYDVMRSSNISKEEVLKKMLQLGGNKFNIYVLHKFINMMRENNE